MPPMRSAVLTLAILSATAAGHADEIRSVEACEAVIAADPEAAREEAALWTRAGGGVPARLCEAAALEAMGADATAARLLTGLAENPNRAMPGDLRASVFEDAARLWMQAGRPDIAEAALLSADRVSPADRARDVLRARIAAGQGNWDDAAALLGGVLSEVPADARVRALRAAALRRGGDPAAALAEAERALADAPDLAEALFEAGAALAESGDMAGARDRWLDLIARHPDDALATLARRNLARLD